MYLEFIFFWRNMQLTTIILIQNRNERKRQRHQQMVSQSALYITWKRSNFQIPATKKVKKARKGQRG